MAIVAQVSDIAPGPHVLGLLTWRFLQTLISYLMSGERVASWLAEQIQDEMARRESNLEKESCIKAIFR